MTADVFQKGHYRRHKWRLGHGHWTIKWTGQASQKLKFRLGKAKAVTDRRWRATPRLCKWMARYFWNFTALPIPTAVVVRQWNFDRRLTKLWYRTKNHDSYVPNIPKAEGKSRLLCMPSTVSILCCLSRMVDVQGFWLVDGSRRLFASTKDFLVRHLGRGSSKLTSTS